MKLLGLGILLLPAVWAFGQGMPTLDYPLSREGRVLDMPWEGGLNNPQPSVVDLTGDGQPELYLFDRTGGVHLAFRADPNAADGWTPAPDLVDSFPELSDWVQLRDFNGDGAPDIFAYSDVPGIPGIVVFRGRFSGGKLKFDRLALNNPYQVLVFSTPTGGELNILVFSIDYPAIADADCDGDLDILTFDPGGTQVEFYRNLSVERGFGLDSLLFIRSTNCWGGFAESLDDEELLLAPAPGLCATPFHELRERSGQPRHSGSSLLLFDRNGDGLQDLLLGDISFPLLTYLQNGNTCLDAWMNKQVVGFPEEDVPVDIPFFPASFLEDVDLDGRPDLLAAPNATSGVEDVEVLWQYADVGTGMAKEFAWQDRSFLVGEMLDLGSGAYPAFADVNQDGLLDLVVGHRSRFESPESRFSGLHLFLNTGTPQRPAFAWTDSDWLGMSTFQSRSSDFVPAFGDLDQDGDLDLIVGEIGGKLFFAGNVAGPGNPMQFSAWQENYGGIDVGEGSAPQIADLNRDGLADLVIGERTGNLNYFPNLGSAGVPRFSPDPEDSFFGKVDSRKPNSNFFAGYSTPYLFDHSDGWHLLTGSQDNGIEHYSDIEGNLGGAFNPLENEFRKLKQGYRTSPAVADIDQDGFLELLVGNARGGLSWFQTELKSLTTSVHPRIPEGKIRLYPNPAVERTFLQWGPELRLREIVVFDLAGRTWRRWEARGQEWEISLADWPKGLYFLRIRADQGQKVLRLIKQ